ncbi:MAG: pyruvate dehydrogenase (acetyl-transferring) E1 component subunit alpha [Rhizobiales bacterium NRL2]|jgi:pyruvate dehydrogenase E1 component alpha subunit|nr:MAG: pyruvate dehydrogenase (acetyl-transferring) E1 component subunit alpha [Rhizobiales bacterium NRL2]
MTREPVDYGDEIPFISVLDENGDIDDDLMPDLGPEVVLKGYRTMLKARRFDERRLKLQRSGRIGTFAPVVGQEASQIGTISTLRKDDWFVPSYRETAAGFWRGLDPADILVFDAGYNEGISIPDDARDLPNAVPVGTQMLQAAGIAHAGRLRGEDAIAMTYFGDGATSQGDFHEALNFAAVYGAPVVFVCQNNQYAISVSREKQTASKTLAQKAVANGLPAVQVDGNDLFAVYTAARDAVKRAREDGQPGMIECVTYRIEMHTTADDPTRYREDDEVEAWRDRDPLDRLGDYLRDRDALDDGKLEKMEKEIEDEIADAWKRAEARIEELEGSDPMFAHIYAEPTPELERQRKAMAERAPQEVHAGEDSEDEENGEDEAEGDGEKDDG